MRRFPRWDRGRLGVRAAVGGLALALVAGAITMAVFLGGGDIAEPDAARSETTTVSTTTTVADAEPSALPTFDWPSFEATFAVDDGTFGHVVYLNEERWKIDIRRWRDDGLSERVFLAGRTGGTNAAMDWPGEDAHGVGEGIMRNELPAEFEAFEFLIAPDRSRDLLGRVASDEDVTMVQPDAERADAATNAPSVSIQWSHRWHPHLWYPSSVHEDGSIRIDVTDVIVRPVTALEAAEQILGELPFIEYLAEFASPDQRPVIADGFVTFDEWRAAVASTWTCVADAYPDEPLPTLDGINTPRELVEIAVPSETDPRFTDCRTAHLDAIEQMWHYQTELMNEDEVARFAYRIEGDELNLEILDSPPGPTVHFPVERGRVSAHLQGPGVCFDVQLSSTGSSGCVPTDLWPVPGRFTVNVAVSSNEDNEIGEILFHGFGPPEGTAVIVELLNGTTSRLPLVDADAEFPYSAFTGVANGRAGEIPTLFRVVDEDGGAIAEFEYQQRFVRRARRRLARLVSVSIGILCD